MVPPDSHRISRAPCYSGKRQESPPSFDYRATTVSGRPFKTVRLPDRLITPRQSVRTSKTPPTTPHMQHLTTITHARFSLIRFRSPLLTESQLFSLPVGTKMFHFPTSPPHALYIQARVTRHDPGRVTPFGNPRITVRLSTPRGLSQIPTSFIGSWCPGIHRMPLHTSDHKQRCSRPLYSSQNTTNTTNHPHHTSKEQPTAPDQETHHHTPTTTAGATGSRSLTTQQRTTKNPRPMIHPRAHPHPQPCTHHAHTGKKRGVTMLLRKEVIQPHLPVRLPCYDLVPIASPTFDGSPHKG